VAGDGHVDLELVDVTESAAPGAKRRVQFSVVFSGPAEPILPQAIYGLEHPKLGAFELFLVPIAAGSYIDHRAEVPRGLAQFQVSCS
jgi:hypothetical protein